MSLLKKILITGASLLAIISAYSYFSPKPASMVIKQLFKEGVAVPPDDYEKIKAQTMSFDNLNYTSKYEDGQLDIVVPKEQSKPLPTILWVHGGAYVGGDKKDITEYATQVAAKGYAVINMNYELAPSATYPTPLKQMDEVYAYMKKYAQKYNLNLDQLFIAGDSAGAQIAGQYINIQVDADYARKVDLQAAIPANTLRGALLFCGPYDLSALDSLSSNRLISFFMQRAGWAYIGERDWQNSPSTQLASLTDTISKNYIPTFITDGNTGSFEEHGVKLAQILTSYDVPVTRVFYPTSEASLGHEYQFMMDLPQAKQTFNELEQFLKTQTN
ncbi:MAG: alpha/beta hydrolase [Kurthia sp.]|nr:alpha/beta hydrolase [Candidatus Kurthia equi]